MNFRDLAALDAGARQARTETSHDVSSLDVRAALLRRYVRGIRPTTRDAGGPAHHASPKPSTWRWRATMRSVSRSLSVEEKDRAKDVAKSGYFPQVRNDTTLVHLTDTQLVEIPGRRARRRRWRSGSAADARFSIRVA